MCRPFSGASGSALTCRGTRTAARSGAGAFDAGVLLSWLQQHAAFHFTSLQQPSWWLAATRRTEQSVNAQTLRGRPDITNATTSHSAAYTLIIGFSVWQRTSPWSIGNLGSTYSTFVGHEIRHRVFSSLRKTRSTGPGGPKTSFHNHRVQNAAPVASILNPSAALPLPVHPPTSMAEAR